MLLYLAKFLQFFLFVKFTWCGVENKNQSIVFYIRTKAMLVKTTSFTSHGRAYSYKWDQKHSATECRSLTLIYEHGRPQETLLFKCQKNRTGKKRKASKQMWTKMKKVCRNWEWKMITVHRMELRRFLWSPLCEDSECFTWKVPRENFIAYPRKIMYKSKVPKISSVFKVHWVLCFIALPVVVKCFGSLYHYVGQV